MNIHAHDFHLHHMATGGTIDSHWDGAKDTAITNDSTVIGNHLKEVARLPSVSSETLYMLDSRGLDTERQSHIADRTTESARKRIVVTIGTFLMPDVARRVVIHPMMARIIGDIDKRVMFTGSTVPIKGFLDSDGGFNLGMATAALQTEGVSRVCVVMSGRVLDATDVYKDLTTATFEGAQGTDQIAYDSLDIVTMGGTIDFMLDGLDGLVPSPESHVPGFLRNQVRYRKIFHAANPFLLDSRKLTDADIERACNIIKGSKQKHILVTTGLYKIVDLCDAINNALPPTGDKCVVFTGSRIPLGLTDASDAPFNLGYAMGALGSLPAGAHIALNGRLYKTTQEIFQGMYTPNEQAELKKRGIIE